MASLAANTVGNQSVAIFDSVYRFHRRPQGMGARQFFTIALVRSFLLHDAPHSSQSTSATTLATYQSLVKELHIEDTVEATGEGVNIMWLSEWDVTHKKVLVYLHAALLLHSVQPHPEVPPLELGDQSLGGAFLISPWVTFKTSSASMIRNRYGDYLDQKSLCRAAEMFTKGVEDLHTTPLSAPATMWKDVKVHHLGILAGGFEIMIDDVIEFALKVKKYFPDMEFQVCDKESHVQVVLNHTLKSPKSESETFFERWLDARYQSRDWTHRIKPVDDNYDAELDYGGVASDEQSPFPGEDEVEKFGTSLITINYLSE
ncbi:hypothetical protein BJX65DRAFT_305677 [Aspergillus insuetus]